MACAVQGYCGKSEEAVFSSWIKENAAPTCSQAVRQRLQFQWSRLRASASNVIVTTTGRSHLGRVVELQAKEVALEVHIIGNRELYLYLRTAESASSLEVRGACRPRGRSGVRADREGQPPARKRARDLRCHALTPGPRNSRQRCIARDRNKTSQALSASIPSD